MINTKMLYTLGDITIIPSEISLITSRSQCIPFVGKLENPREGFYPIIVAPMSSVTDDKNYKTFWDNKISCIIPRNIPIEKRLELCKEVFCAFGISEIEDHFINNQKPIFGKIHILIDIANGHMDKQIKIGKKLKDLYQDNISLMGGNIANPVTYTYYNSAGFDYLRVGIAGGSQCLTGTHTGIYYPMASLIADTYEVKRKIPGATTKIIADGGIGSYSDAIKCLALGADYVMMGKVFAKALEACGSIYERQAPNPEKYGMDDYINVPITLDRDDLGYAEIPKPEKDGTWGWYRSYYGMSTKLAQAEMLGYTADELSDAKKMYKFKTAEGRSEEVLIEYTISGWIENMDSYLRSSMSYCNSLTLDQFKTKAICQLISTTSSKGINEK